MAWRLALHSNLGRGFSMHLGRIEAVLVQVLFKHKAKAPAVHKNAMRGGLAHV